MSSPNGTPHFDVSYWPAVHAALNEWKGLAVMCGPRGLPLSRNILYHNDGQKAAAEKSMKEAQKELSRPIVTQIVPLKKFWPAEAYHQDYFRNNPDQGYCQMVVRPKVEKVEKKLKAEKK